MAGHPFYKTADWYARIRPRQLARAPLCEWPDCNRPADTVDHIIPIKQGGPKRDPANLQSLCTDHHQVKRSAEAKGLDWRQVAYRGCDSDGTPLDPSHPWNVQATHSRDEAG